MRMQILRSLGLGAAIAVMLAGGPGTRETDAAPVKVTQRVSCSSNQRTATALALALPQVAFSQGAQVTNGVLTFTAADETCSAQGWAVTVQLAQIEYTGNGHATTIPAENVVLGTPEGLELVAGQPIIQAGGPWLGTGGSLHQPRKVAYAKAGFGMGEYQFTAPVMMTLPPRTTAGTYSALLTVTMSAGPGG